MKIIMNKILAFFVLLLCVLAFVSCDSAVSESGEALVRFGEADGSSRGISADDLEGYTVDGLYWAYVAVKKDGLHTIGESEVTTTAASTGSTGFKIVTVDSKNYILRPVRPDYEPGLNADVGPFSYGDWLFKLYGFKSFNGTTFADLVYTGDTVGYTAITKSSTTVSVGFNLSPATGTGTAFPTTGTLVFGSLYYTVPANMKFYAGTTFTVTFKDATNGDKVVATATGSITADSNAGAKIPLSITYGAASAFDSGVQGQFNTPASSYQSEHKFKIEVVYQSGVTSGTGHLQEPVTLPSSTRTFPVLFTAGNLTVLYGDVDDVVVDNGKSEVDNFGPVCRIGTKYYTSLTDAVAAYSGTAIEVFRNIDYGGSFSKDFKICPIGSVIDGSVVGNNRCYVKNITMAAGTKVEFVAELTDTSGITYTGSGTLNFLNWSAGTCFADTTGGTLTVNSSGTNLYHTGTCANVTVTDAKKDKTNGLGYHCWGTVTGTLTVTKGYVDFGATASVETLTTNPTASGNVVLTGHPTTSIGNMSTIYEGTSLTSDILKSPYKKVVFNGNGGKTSSGATTLTKYGIEGMYLYNIIQIGVFDTCTSTTAPKLQYWWATTAAGDYPLYNAAVEARPTAENLKYLVNSDAVQNLFAFWETKMLPVGGYIFAFASGGVPCTTEITGGDDGAVAVNGVTYRFYDEKGRYVNVKGKKYKTNTVAGYKNEAQSSVQIISYSATASGCSYTLLSALKDGNAKYYEIIGKPATGYKDGVYVCPTNGYGPQGVSTTKPSSPIRVAFGGGGSNERGCFTYVLDDGGTSTIAEPGFGEGKNITKATIAACTNKCLYVVSGVTGSTKNTTVWSQIDWMNNGGKSDKTGTPWASATNSTGCFDWFIPDVVEIGVMYFSGVLPSAWFAIPTSDSYRHIVSCCERRKVSGTTTTYMTHFFVKDSSGFRNGAGVKTLGGSFTVDGTIPCRSF